MKPLNLWGDYHIDTPQEWTNFLASLPYFTNLKEVSLDNCHMISSIEGCFPIGLSIGRLGKKEFKELVTAVKDLPQIHLNIASSFDISEKDIKRIKTKLKKPDLIID